MTSQLSIWRRSQGRTRTLTTDLGAYGTVSLAAPRSGSVAASVAARHARPGSCTPWPCWRRWGHPPDQTKRALLAVRRCRTSGPSYPSRGSGTGNVQPHLLVDRREVTKHNRLHLTRELVKEPEASRELRHLHITLGHLDDANSDASKESRSSDTW